jgi:hypothetical protein
MRTRILATVGLLACASALGAQTSQRRFTPEVRPLIGVFVPTGSMRDDFKTATLLGAQVALELSSNWHVLSNVSFTHGHNRLYATSDRTNIWQYDAGVEGNLVVPMGERWLFRPFAGLGAGGRTYDYRGEVDTRSCTAGYGALGSEFQTGPVALRLEARDYLSCFESPISGYKKTRNDLGFAFGLAYHIR